MGDMTREELVAMTDEELLAYERGQRRSGRTGRSGLEGRDVLDTDEHAVTGGVVG